MKVSVFGLGYVGAVSCACLPELGHQVIGVDTNPLKVRLIGSGESPVVEAGINELIAAAVARGDLRATLDLDDAVRHSEISLISVATPSNPDYSPNLSAVDAVVASIGRALRDTAEPHVLVLRSTLAPGTTAQRLVPILEEAAGRRV
ncbi:MAG: GDP-mannose dehydrogenase, partial [Burkholderiales bacterium]|nr:GDP-mannose dehydrogenase [Burkholderiales bacterium]